MKQPETREAFAQKQTQAQSEAEKELTRSARVALRKMPAKNWYSGLLNRAERVMRARYRIESGKPTSPALRIAVVAFRRDSEKSLKKTTKPEPEQIESRAKAIAASLATGAVNAALVAAAKGSPESGWFKVWHSMEDERVRPSHAAANGQKVRLDRLFKVGGHKMSRPGDTRAPIDEWINCRCIITLERGEDMDAVAAAAGQYESHGVGIFLIPAKDDSIHDLSSEDRAHVTVCWLGMDDEQTVDLDELRAAVERVSADTGPIVAEVTERGTLGDDEADVLFLQGDALLALREALMAEEVVATQVGAVEQYPQWTPHLTIGYPDTPANEGDIPTDIALDRLALWVGDDGDEFALTGEAMADEEIEQVEETEDEEFPELAEADRLEYSDEPIPFWGVLAPEGVLSGDSRKFSAGSLLTRDLPLPLSYQRENWQGHDSSVKVGNIERIWRRDGKVYKMGHFLTVVPEVDEVVGMMAESGGRMGVSVDADRAEMEMQTKDGTPIEDASEEEQIEAMFGGGVTVFTSARACGATLCHIPAFQEAFTALGNPPEELMPQDGEDLLSVRDEEAGALAASVSFVKTEDGPGWLTHPVDTDRLRDYWTHGKGAAKIGWGAPGDFNRCRANLAKYVKPQYLSGYCANRHYDALGFWPGEHHSGKTLAATAASAAPEDVDGWGLRLVASGADLARPPKAWFENPNLDGPSGITVTEDGRVFGHLAEWGVCHIGISGVCTEPPHSETNYSGFHLGYIVTTEGDEVPCGQITLGTGHADLKLNAKATMAHYDNTGTAVADVVVGEDEWGIWVAGAMRPWASEQHVHELRAAKLSGDWRDIRGHLELVAALAVNVPGFPIPRVALAASGGHQTALVAAGIVEAAVSEKSLAEIVGAAVSEALDKRERAEARKRIQKIAAKAGRDPKSRMKRLAAARKAD